MELQQGGNGTTRENEELGIRGSGPLSQRYRSNSYLRNIEAGEEDVPNYPNRPPIILVTRIGKDKMK